jgi:hypothetical protein
MSSPAQPVLTTEDAEIVVAAQAIVWTRSISATTALA